MRPAPERTTSCDDLLRVSTRWAATALVQDLAGPLTALRANVQAARRLLASECPHSTGLAATLADVLEDADRLESVVTALRESPEVTAPRARLQPELEIAAAASLLGGPDGPLPLESDTRAPRVTARPGVIGAAVLHLLLSRPGSGARVVKIVRPQPARLVVRVVYTAAPAAIIPLHAAAAAAAVERLGGILDLDAAGGPRLEIPLEL